MLKNDFWKNKKVFLTGHTGFKGSWLCLWLYSLGADVVGYALQPPTGPGLFNLCNIEGIVASMISDIRDAGKLTNAIADTKPEIVIHMAAQPLVRYSYENPTETYSVNVMGTVNLFEAIRKCPTVKAVLNITTDKCYENREWLWGYRENEPLGGADPYSSSKACSELVTAAYRHSFFSPNSYEKHGVAVASARAGNVIGGGDWAKDRLIPDCIRALMEGEKIFIRNPCAIRPWQHVLEPLNGYLMLAQKLYEEGIEYAESWNFGPREEDAGNVESIVKELCKRLDRAAAFEIDNGDHPHEANYLKLDSSKARIRLGWRPKWDVKQSLDKIIEWTNAYKNGADLREISLNQIKEYSAIQIKY